jgi:S1-C subfamily serine protease
VIVHEVEQFSPAAGIVFPGDQLVRINGRDVNSVQEVERISEGLRSGQVVSLVVKRGDREPRIVNYRVR